MDFLVSATMRAPSNADRNEARSKAVKLNAAKVRAAKRDDLLRGAFAETLRKFRIDAGLTQAQLAKKAALPSYVVGSLERKGRAIDLREERKLCQALEVPIAKFLEEARQAELRALEAIEAEMQPAADVHADLGPAPPVLAFEQAYEVVSNTIKDILLHWADEALASARSRNQERLGAPRRVRRRSST
jgi:transcriptional regulator with XRE-family HTH domain